ncbi:MAG: hemerythrin domain-containing protein [Labilithrix sp.]|nr:hemerythrin domain-containing protein [Labilithrix sp.]
MIGRRRRESGDLVDALMECHARVRSCSRLAVEIGERADAPADEVAYACARVERYFTEALPLHVRDEEESVLPRLRGRTASLDAALEQIHEQHDLHARLIERTCAAAAALRAKPLKAAARKALVMVARPLEVLFESHLRVEEAVIFTAIRAHLPTETQNDIADEMRRRRRHLHRW